MKHIPSKKLIVLLFLCSTALATVFSQSVWDTTRLSQVKGLLQEPHYNVAYQELVKQAEKALTQPCVSVMMKEKTPPSGNMHDYLSQARYYWPDTSKPDGKPYINRDGISNPELNKLDRNRLGQMAGNITTLALAWYFSDDERYAQKAAEQLQVWFLNEETKMNPHLKYAQMIPGHNNELGRCYGVIDTYSFVEMLDAVQLLEHAESFSKKDAKALKVWFGELLKWIQTSEQGKEEAQQKNNHSTAHDVQVIVFALYTGNEKVARKVLSDFPEKRIYKQIEPDGKQPNELWRTLAFGYSEYNLQHMIDVSVIGKNKGISLEKVSSPDGRNIFKAADFLAPFLGKDVSAWPYEQISEWNEKQQELCKDLYRLYLLDNQRADYLNYFRQYWNPDLKDRFNLLFLHPAHIAQLPGEVERMFTFAETQLKYAIQSTEEARKKADKNNSFNPRTVEKDGQLRIVSPHDWCSGFFPGSLWQLYAYTKDNYWKEQAAAYTWPLEEVKKYHGTHDLGFIVYSSFGRGYDLTGDTAYREVVIQAANTLCTRYNPTVKSIRSWDFNRQIWEFPVIIDNIMNLELLFRATQLTGDSIYRHIAVTHANTTLKNHFREDASSYHVVDYDTLTGNVRMKCTLQGIADESVWSRGQAWGLYGYTMCYRFTRDPVYLEQAEKIADFFLNLPDLPDDLIPYWDMKDPAIPTAPRDVSAASVMASGLYEMSMYVSGEKQQYYKLTADKIIQNLNLHYRAGENHMKGFLLLHSTGNYPANDEVDVPISYADYYYLEALSRAAAVSSYTQAYNVEKISESIDKPDASLFVTVRGHDLIRPDGTTLFIMGTNLGNWLNPEGYMFRFRKTNSGRFINEMFCQLVGPDFTAGFWKAFKDNYITRDDILFIRETGANTIRLPFHYKLFTDEDYMGLTANQDGFARIDSVVDWCREAGMYLILDMHDAPGGQTGDNIDDSYGYPWLFESETSQKLYCDIWRKIADYYKDEPIILGYELLNEPIAPYFPNMDELNGKLEEIYKKGTAAIREVDKNHIVILGGAQWNGNFKPFTDAGFDNKIMYSCHRYGGAPTKEAIQEIVNFRDSVNLPMFMGEIGHNTDEWQSAFCRIMKENNMGYTFWPYKKMDGSSFVGITPPEHWDAIVTFSEVLRSSYKEIRDARPDQAIVRKAMMDFIKASKLENCVVQEGYIRSLEMKE